MIGPGDEDTRDEEIERKLIEDDADADFKSIYYDFIDDYE